MTTAPELTAGMIIANRFRLEHLLGQGGMGSVWVAQHLTLNVPVAVKFVDPALGSRDEVRSRFAQEAQAAAKINSPHVVRMVDYGTDEWGRPYIAMELMQGEELAKRLEREPMMQLRDVARVLSQAAKGLTKAHQAGITHRDLKPENLFLAHDDDGFVTKVLDFGIAKADSPIGGLSHRTGTGQIVGTPAYMSPEQALGAGQVDFRSDLYSLAVVIYRCLTGKVPFECQGLGELIVAITSRPHPPPSSLRADLTPAIDGWFARAMHKDPAQRFQSAKEMSDAFAIACGFSIASGSFGAPSYGAPAASAPMSSAPMSSMPMGSSPMAATTPFPSQPYASTSGSMEPVRPGTLMSSASTKDDPVAVPTSKPVVLYAILGLVALFGLGAGGALLLRSSGSSATAGPAPGTPISSATEPARAPAAPPSAPSPVVTPEPAAASTTAPAAGAAPNAPAAKGAKGAKGAVEKPKPEPGAKPDPVPAPPPPAPPAKPTATARDYGLLDERPRERPTARKSLVFRAGSC